MPSQALLNAAINALWETLPPAWMRIRTQIRDNATQGHGISLVQFHILRHSRRGINTSAALAEHLQISRPAASQAVEGLVQKGLLQRLPSKQDRRKIYLQPSAAGNTLLEEGIQRSQSWMAEKLQTLQDSDLQTLLQAMSTLQALFDIPSHAGPKP
jgi:DNA-binding MarR family transcriptional regulator